MSPNPLPVYDKLMRHNLFAKTELITSKLVMNLCFKHSKQSERALNLKFAESCFMPGLERFADIFLLAISNHRV